MEICNIFHGIQQCIDKILIRLVQRILNDLLGHLIILGQFPVKLLGILLYSLIAACPDGFDDFRYDLAYPLICFAGTLCKLLQKCLLVGAVGINLLHHGFVLLFVQLCFDLFDQGLDLRLPQL